VSGRLEIKIVRERKELMIRDRRWRNIEKEKNRKYNTRETGIKDRMKRMTQQ
jgi:hypothetical protein